MKHIAHSEVVQYLIAYSMLKRGKTWEIWSRAVKAGRHSTRQMVDTWGGGGGGGGGHREPPYKFTYAHVYAHVLVH